MMTFPKCTSPRGGLNGISLLSSGVCVIHNKSPKWSIIKWRSYSSKNNQYLWFQQSNLAVLSCKGEVLFISNLLNSLPSNAADDRLAGCACCYKEKKWERRCCSLKFTVEYCCLLGWQLQSKAGHSSAHPHQGAASAHSELQVKLCSVAQQLWAYNIPWWKDWLFGSWYLFYSPNY